MSKGLRYTSQRFGSLDGLFGQIHIHRLVRSTRKDADHAHGQLIPEANPSRQPGNMALSYQAPNEDAPIAGWILLASDIPSMAPPTSPSFWLSGSRRWLLGVRSSRCRDAIDGMLKLKPGIAQEDSLAELTTVTAAGGSCRLPRATRQGSVSMAAQVYRVACAAGLRVMPGERPVQFRNARWNED